MVVGDGAPVAGEVHDAPLRGQDEGAAESAHRVAVAVGVAVAPVVEDVLQHGHPRSGLWMGVGRERVKLNVGWHPVGAAAGEIVAELIWEVDHLAGDAAARLQGPPEAGYSGHLVHADATAAVVKGDGDAQAAPLKLIDRDAVLRQPQAVRERHVGILHCRCRLGRRRKDVLELRCATGEARSRALADCFLWVAGPHQYEQYYSYNISGFHVISVR